jgi:electron transfer flavoprotein beta subunit
MKILTLVRQVPDAESALRISNGAVDDSATKLVMDTMDEYGVEQALRLREAGSAIGTDVEVVALAVGPAKNEDVLRNALALGADRAIHVKAGTTLDPIALSKVIAQIAQAEAIDLVLTGGRQSDWDSEALGAAVAERLGGPQLTWTTELTFNGNQLTGRHDIDDGSEAFMLALPAVVTTQQGLNEPRFPTLPNIVKARKKELRSETLEQYGVLPLVTTVNIELQPRARLRQILSADGDLDAAANTVAEILRKELEVLA